jgi:hypothetical protein
MLRDEADEKFEAERFTPFRLFLSAESPENEVELHHALACCGRLKKVKTMNIFKDSSPCSPSLWPQGYSMTFCF